MLLGPAGDLCGQMFDAIDDDGSGFLEEAEGKVYLQIGRASCRERV